MSQIQTKILQQLLTLITLMIVFISCQQEFTEIVEPDKNVTISAGDHIADLIFKVVLKDGSFDNIVDGSSEISIELPYSVSIEDELFYVGTVEDLEVLKLQYFFERDDIEINYPVTATFSDYSELLLSDEDELEEIQEEYNTLLKDDDIECVDFIYPIELSIYNNVRQSIDELTVNNDREMYNVFVNIQDLFVDINYPIEIESLDGERVVINNNKQLEEEIENKMDSCDEDDKVEFEDDDFPYKDIISRDKWIVTFYADTTEETSLFNEYTFIFKIDNIVQASKEGEITDGEWELDLSLFEKVLELEFDTDDTPLVWMNEDWKIKNISDEHIELEAESKHEGFIKKLQLSKVD